MRPEINCLNYTRLFISFHYLCIFMSTKYQVRGATHYGGGRDKRMNIKTVRRECTTANCEQNAEPHPHDWTFCLESFVLIGFFPLIHQTYNFISLESSSRPSLIPQNLRRPKLNAKYSKIKHLIHNFLFPILPWIYECACKCYLFGVGILFNQRVHTYMVEVRCYICTMLQC